MGYEIRDNVNAILDLVRFTDIDELKVVRQRW